MKKNYIKPNIEVLFVEVESLLAASIGFGDEGLTGQGDLNDEVSEIDALSKEHFSVWE